MSDNTKTGNRNVVEIPRGEIEPQQKPRRAHKADAAAGNRK